MHGAESSESSRMAESQSSLERSAVSPSLRQYGLRAIVILFILNAIDEFDRAVLAVALDDIREDFGVSDAAVGLLPLAVIFITGILALPAGNLADRWSRRNILVIGAVIWGSAGIFACGGAHVRAALLHARAARRRAGHDRPDSPEPALRLLSRRRSWPRDEHTGARPTRLARSSAPSSAARSWRWRDGDGRSSPQPSPDCSSACTR